jgi:hypothetical protein
LFLKRIVSFADFTRACQVTQKKKAINFLMGKDISKMKEIHACTPTQEQPYTMNFATKSKRQVA